MGDYYGMAGKNIFLANTESKECACFDSFGSFMGMSHIIECKNSSRVDIVSIIGSPNTSKCELYINGKVLSIDKQVIAVLNAIRRKYVNLVGSVVFAKPLIEDRRVLCNQYFLVYDLGVLSTSGIEEALGLEGVANWVSLPKD